MDFVEMPPLEADVSKQPVYGLLGILRLSLQRHLICVVERELVADLRSLSPLGPVFLNIPPHSPHDRALGFSGAVE